MTGELFQAEPLTGHTRNQTSSCHFSKVQLSRLKISSVFGKCKETGKKVQCLCSGEQLRGPAVAKATSLPRAGRESHRSAADSS